MPQPKSKQRAQGAGRTANSEPRVQVFKSFNGMDFEHSPRDVLSSYWSEDPDQNDLMMTKTALQSNVCIPNNMTLESTPNPIKLNIYIENKWLNDFKNYYNIEKAQHFFYGPACLVGSTLFLAFYINVNGNPIYNVGKIELGHEKAEMKVLKNVPNSFTRTVGRAVSDYQMPMITQIYWAGERLLVLDTKGQVWRSITTEHVSEYEEPGPLVDTIYGAKIINNPSAPSLSNITVHGNVKLSQTYNKDTHPYRIRFAYCYNTEFGPTKVSPALCLYSSMELSDWDESNYITFKSPVATFNEFGITSISLYYTVDDASELQFGQMGGMQDSDGKFTLDFFGYLTDTSAWVLANLDAPDKNYTAGPTARYCTMIDGRMYFWGGSDTGMDAYDDLAPNYRIIIGGNPGNIFSSSPSTGGGFVDIEPGTGKFVNDIVKYRTQSGANIVTALCGSRQSQEELRYNLVTATVSLSSDNSMNSWTAEHVSGSVGCRDTFGALVCEDGLYTTNRYGLALTTMAMEYNNQLRTQYVSDPIKPVFIADNLADSYKEFLIHCDGIVYYGKTVPDDPRVKTSVVFCYDVNLKAWWCITVPDLAFNAIHIDSKKHAEGIGFICKKDVYVVPTTNQTVDYGIEKPTTKIIETANLSTTQPNHGYHHLTQIEIDFDYFIGDVLVELIGIDIFGRKITVRKRVEHSEAKYALPVYMRVDMKLLDYKIRITGEAKFRINCFLAKLYTMSNKVGLVWGFDDSISNKRYGDIHPTFKNYNEVIRAVIP